MTKFYIQAPWPPFNEFDLSHLKEEIIEVSDSKNVVRRVLLVYSDHCFTRQREEGDASELTFPNGSRGRNTMFCPIRYRYSLELPSHIRAAVTGNVWIADGEHFAIIRDAVGIAYGIFFSLDPAKGLPCELVMRIRSAFPMEEPPVTHGKVRYSHLVTLRLQGKRPPRTITRHQKKPNLRPKK